MDVRDRKEGMGAVGGAGMSADSTAGPSSSSEDKSLTREVPVVPRDSCRMSGRVHQGCQAPIIAPRSPDLRDCLKPSCSSGLRSSKDSSAPPADIQTDSESVECCIIQCTTHPLHSLASLSTIASDNSSSSVPPLKDSYQLKGKLHFPNHHNG